MTLRAAFILASVLLIISLPAALLAAEWYVDGSAASSGDGTSWANAFETIQEGIDAASDGDIVIVIEGTYVENVHFNGKNITLRSGDPVDPDVVARTVIDGNQAGPVVTFAGTESGLCVLTGFTIRNGMADEGGGVCGYGALVTVQFNLVTLNSANSSGAGLYGCHGTISDNVIFSNYSSGHGAGLSVCHGIIQNNTITGNEARGRGGGLHSCDATIEANVIRDNSANDSGGGLSDCHGIIRNNMIAANSADVQGGGFSACTQTISNNTVAGNIAQSGGGFYACPGRVQSNKVVGNSANRGGALYLCDGEIRNNTIVGNLTIGSNPMTGGLFNCHGVIENCIIWGNEDPQGRQVLGLSVPTFSCIQNWAEGGEGNVSADPGFVDYAGGDYHLLENSPCIDAGMNADWMQDAVDLDGNPRIWGNSVDMGAYEYGSFPFKITHVLPTLTWRSRGGDTYTVQFCSDPSSGVWDVEATVPSQGDSTTWSDSDTTSPQKFYRIEIE